VPTLLVVVLCHNMRLGNCQTGEYSLDSGLGAVWGARASFQRRFKCVALRQVNNKHYR